jgi:transcriptional regulator with XRE-family HTH domain
MTAEGEEQVGAAEPRSAIGTRVRAARDRRGWNRETLAFHSGVSWTGIAQVETGRRTNLRLATLTALATALGVSVDYLVTGRFSNPPMFEHRALLYETEDEFARCIVPFLDEAIQRHEPALVVTTDANIELLRNQLGSASAQVEFVERTSWYSAPHSTLEGYRSFLDKAIDGGGNWIRIVGEIAWEGLSETAVRSWGRYESLLNLSFASAPATLICPYDTRVASPAIIDVACATHPQLAGANRVDINAQYAEVDGFLLEP